MQVQPRTGDATPDATGLVGSATEAATPTINASTEEPPAKTDGSSRVALRVERLAQAATVAGDCGVSSYCSVVRCCAL